MHLPVIILNFQELAVKFKKNAVVISAVGLALMLSGCATETSRPIEAQQTAAAARPYAGERQPVSVGKFDNRSSFLRGVFSDGVDRLGSQAKTILVAHLQQSNRFSVLDRQNLSETKQEAEIARKQQALKGARYVITGDVTEFGRKEVGDHQLFGLLGRGKQQVAYAKVALNVVDVETSEVIYSTFGAGEYALSNREVIGFGGTASYDSTLNGKVLDLAIREAVDALVKGVESGAWRPVH
jgi:curli biogenesis system outer membrane secretion channel CsgG